jgi:hypothetical protein
MQVGSAQAEDFAAAHAGEGGQPPGGVQPVVSDAMQKPAQLLSCPGLQLSAGSVGGVEGGVAREQAPADGAVEGFYPASQATTSRSGRLSGPLRD